MFSVFKNRFGVPGIVSVVALVFAMVGGAYAASGGLSGKQKKEVKSIAKSFQGTGPAGANGTNGANGAPGAKGEKGDAGNAGGAGAAGTSATTTSFGGEQHGCKEGGIEVKTASPAAYVCNGVKGTNGTFGTEPLLQGQSLMGTWATSGGPTSADEENGDYSMVPISFPIAVSPVPTALVQLESASPLGIKVESENWGLEAEFAEHCPGTVAAPEAEPGFLCVYKSTAPSGANLDTANKPLFEAAHEFGIVLPFRLTEEGAFAKGSWAVTAS
jgi:hypothetical protein